MDSQAFKARLRLARHGLIASLCAGYLAGCGTATALPSPTAIPGPTATAVPVIDSALLTSAGAACQTAWSSPLVPHPDRFTAADPTLTLIRDTASSDAAWTWAGEAFDLPKAEAATEAELQSLVCIQETISEDGRYTSGQIAYQRMWAVLLVSWPDGRILNTTTLISSPPSSITLGTGGVGARPVEELYAWMARPTNGRSLRLWQQQFSAAVQAVIPSPDGTRMAVGLEDGALHILEVATGHTQHTFHRTTPVGFNFAQRAWGVFLFSPDGKTIIGWTAPDKIAEWDTASGQERQLYSVPFQEADLYGGRPPIRLASDGRILSLTQTEQGRVRLWDIRTGQVAKEIAMGGDAAAPAPLYVAWSPSLETVAVLDKQTNQVRLWDLASGQPTQEFEAAPFQVFPVFFSPDGRHLIGFAGTRSVIWDAAAGKVTGIIGEQNFAANRMGLSSDGKTLALCDGGTHELQAWSVQTATLLVETKSQSCFADTLPETGTLLTIGEIGELVFWNPTTAERVGRVPNLVAGFLSPTDGLTVFPDGMTVADWDSFGRLELRNIQLGQ